MKTVGDGSLTSPSSQKTHYLGLSGLNCTILRRKYYLRTSGYIFLWGIGGFALKMCQSNTLKNIFLLSVILVYL